MKKFLLLALLIFISSTQVSKAQSYRGFVDCDPGITLYSRPNNTYGSGLRHFTIGFTTTHGVQIKKAFIGAGAGFLAIAGKDGEFTYYVPMYGNFRYDFFGSKKYNFFASLGIGYSLSLDDDYGNLYYQPTIGIRFKLTDILGINVGLTYYPLKYQFDCGSYHHDGTYTSLPKDVITNTFGLMFGLDF